MSKQHAIIYSTFKSAEKDLQILTGCLRLCLNLKLARHLSPRTIKLVEVICRMKLSNKVLRVAEGPGELHTGR